jgi:hypothetical protein
MLNRSLKSHFHALMLSSLTMLAVFGSGCQHDDPLMTRSGAEKEREDSPHSRHHGQNSFGASYLPDCNDPSALAPQCIHPSKEVLAAAHAAGYPHYVGHAEPAALFFSRNSNSASNLQWKLTLPATDPSPTQSGSAVANFELFITQWFSLAMCDPTSKPYGSCKAASDDNDPSTAGSAFMELQIYPPGINCSDKSKWCAALTIDSLHDNSPSNIAGCFEPVTSAWVTTNGLPSGPQLAMSTGDTILVTIQDTPSGLKVTLKDASGATGTMVASGANGFVHNKTLSSCATEPFDFHPLYATAASNHTVGWLELNANVSFASEIGHWELCGNTSCTIKPDGADEAESFCGTIRGVGGCTDKDTDQDGLSYQTDWPDGTSAHPGSLAMGSSHDVGVGPLSATTSDATNYVQGYDLISFRTTESTATTFYPFFSAAGSGNSCRFNFGNDIPGATTTDFAKAAQYGPSLFRSNSCYPGIFPWAVASLAAL